VPVSHVQQEDLRGGGGRECAGGCHVEGGGGDGDDRGGSRNGGEGCFAEDSTTVSLAEEGQEVELTGELMGELPRETLVAVPDPSVSKPLLLVFGGSIARQDSAPRPICGRRCQKDVGAGEHP